MWRMWPLMRKTRLISNGLRKCVSGHFTARSRFKMPPTICCTFATNADHHLPLWQNWFETCFFCLYKNNHRRQLNQPTTDPGTVAWNSTNSLFFCHFGITVARVGALWFTGILEAKLGKQQWHVEFRFRFKGKCSLTGSSADWPYIALKISSVENVFFFSLLSPCFLVKNFIMLHGVHLWGFYFNH
jgi:hypothetical protein